MAPVTFECMEDGRNVVEGLELFNEIIPETFQAELLQFVEEQIVLGESGKLVGRTYLPPEKKVWAKRSKSRLLLQYGHYTYCNRVQDTVPVAQIPECVHKLVTLLQETNIVDDEINQCTINVYEKGNWLPAHVDNVLFERPFYTVSLLSEQTIVMGERIEMPQDGHFNGQLDVRLPIGSVLKMSGASAGPTKHAVPSVTARRVSFTLRKLGGL